MHGKTAFPEEIPVLVVPGPGERFLSKIEFLLQKERANTLVDFPNLAGIKMKNAKTGKIIHFRQEVLSCYAKRIPISLCLKTLSI